MTQSLMGKVYVNYYIWLNTFYPEEGQKLECVLVNAMYTLVYLSQVGRLERVMKSYFEKSENNPFLEGLFKSVGIDLIDSPPLLALLVGSSSSCSLNQLKL